MRTLIVSHRLPIAIERRAKRLRLAPSLGGLATGLHGVHQKADSWWVGYRGEVGEGAGADVVDIDEKLRALRLEPVSLTQSEVDGYYERLANGVLWPLFHYLPEQLPLEITDWAVYEAVNARFAAAVTRLYQPGDRIWVHDYQLMLVPDMLRGRLPAATIGFFLHIPFPASELFRILPFRERILEGLLGADLVGFHTAAYARHFGSSLLRLLGLAANVDRVRLAGREVRIGVFPMGIDSLRWTELARSPEVAQAAESNRDEQGCALFVGIDRLDYTKGIPRRLLAFERMLATHPELHERVRLVQLAVPSRTGVKAYREFRTYIESLVGRVNGRFGSPRWAPVHYLHRSLDQTQIITLYRAADVMLVTPVRDGMNLVAKEFIACRDDEAGVLVLSEFTGAAAELAEALHVNPYDIEHTAAAFHRALTMSQEERRERMRGLRQRVQSYDVGRWAEGFLDALDVAGTQRHMASVAMTTEVEIGRVISALQDAEHLSLFLDYDGTLVPFAAVPELAIPDASLLDLLGRLAKRRATTLDIVSGRSHEALDRWLGRLPVGLHAEHGVWSKSPHGKWEQAPLPKGKWMERALFILEEFRARTPGSLIERKTAALAWHYRMADVEFGALQANELRAHLTELLSNEPVEILAGEKVIELRPYGIHKGRIVERALHHSASGTVAVAMGDDRTDEDMFAALPAGSVAIHVGAAASRAAVRIRDWRVARSLLELLAAGGTAGVHP